jgi:hypothetical protein
MKISNKFALAALLALMILTIPLTAFAEVSVTLCHATSSATNPYTIKTVSGNAVANMQKWMTNGHGGHSGDIWPAFTLEDGTTVGAQGDQRIFANGCQPLPPDPTEEPTGEPTDEPTEEPSETPPPPVATTPPSKNTLVYCLEDGVTTQSVEINEARKRGLNEAIWNGTGWVCEVNLCNLTTGRVETMYTQEDADAALESGNYADAPMCTNVTPEPTPVTPPEEVPPTYQDGPEMSLWDRFVEWVMSWFA